jgi:hypothetical protein
MKRPVRDFFNSTPTRVELEFAFIERDRNDFTTYDALDSYLDAREDGVTGATNRDNVSIKSRGDVFSFAIVEKITVTERFTEDYLEEIKTQMSKDLPITKDNIVYEISVVTDTGV